MGCIVINDLKQEFQSCCIGDVLVCTKSFYTYRPASDGLQTLVASGDIVVFISVDDRKMTLLHPSGAFAWPMFWGSLNGYFEHVITSHPIQALQHNIESFVTQ